MGYRKSSYTHNIFILRLLDVMLTSWAPRPLYSFSTFSTQAQSPSSSDFPGLPTCPCAVNTPSVYIFVSFISSKRKWSICLNLHNLKGNYFHFTGKVDTERTRTRDIFPLLNHFPNTLDTLDWARLKPGDSIWVSGMDGRSS